MRSKRIKDIKDIKTNKLYCITDLEDKNIKVYFFCLKISCLKAIFNEFDENIYEIHAIKNGKIQLLSFNKSFFQIKSFLVNQLN